VRYQSLDLKHRRQRQERQEVDVAVADAANEEAVADEQ
jgi:hypothetical protein